MQKIIVFKDGPHRLSPISYWGIAYAQKLLQINGAWTPAANNIAILAALLSEAEDKKPDLTPVKEWGFAEAAALITTPTRPKLKNGKIQPTRLEELLNELYDAGFVDDDAAPDEDMPDDALPPTPRPGGVKHSRSPRSQESTSTPPGE